MVDLWVWDKFLAPISVTLGQGHLATEAGRNLPCPHDKVRIAYPIASKPGRNFPLIMIIHLSNFYRNSVWHFFRKNWNLLSPVESSICHILGIVGPIDVSKERKWVNWMPCWLGYLWSWPLTSTFDLEFSRSNCISGMGDPIVMVRRGRELIRCPGVKHWGKWINWMLRCLGYHWHWIFKVKQYLGNGRPDCHGTKGTGVDRMPWCETLKKWVNRTLRWMGYLWPLPLTLNSQSQIVSREWEASLSWNERDGSR